MPRAIFKSKVIAAAGPLPGQLTIDNLKHWTRIRKGVFIDGEVTEAVTHLLCTVEQHKKKVDAIKKALAYGKKIRIVHHDWFEFSADRNTRLPEGSYCMRKKQARQNAVQRRKLQIEKGKEEGETWINTNLYRVYADEDNFFYQVTLTREDPEFGGEGQRHVLYLFESKAEPRLYYFGVKFFKKKGDSQPKKWRPSLCEGRFEDEVAQFKAFFKTKTGIAWEDRVSLQRTMGENYFQYDPPTAGKPVGGMLRFSHDYCLEINAQARGLP